MNVYVFSYNRGEFLDNCLHSIELCLPNHEVHVLDDNSQDQLTQEVLARWSDRFHIHQSEQMDADHKVGGLNRNMQWALDHAVATDSEFALFIQDDMQIVRRFEPADSDSIQGFFNANASAIIFQPCFMKKCDYADETEKTRVDTSGYAYLRLGGHSRQLGFSDVGIFHVSRFHKLFGPLVGGEGENNRRSEYLGLQMGISVNPFMMWLPMPISHRGKRRNLTLRFQEWLFGGGFHPYALMDHETVSRLTSRDSRMRAFAEDWLKSPGVKQYKCWAFVGGRSALYEIGGWRRQVAQMQYASKQWIKKFKRLPTNVATLAKSLKETMTKRTGRTARTGQQMGAVQAATVLMIRKVNKPFGEAQYGYDLLLAYSSWEKRPIVFSHQSPIPLPPTMADFPISQPKFIAPPLRLQRKSSSSFSLSDKLNSRVKQLKYDTAFIYRWIGLARQVSPQHVSVIIRNHFPDPQEVYPDPTFPNARVLLFVHSMPDFFDGRKTDLDIQWARWSLQEADGLVFVSKVAQREWNKQVNIQRKPQYILGNTCREGDINRVLRRTKETLREELGLPEESVLFVNIGTLQERKAQLELVHALAASKFVELTDWRLLLIGYEQESYAESVKQLIKKKNLGDQISILGPKSNPLEYMRAADYTIQSSRSESFGRVLLESLALGVPVISTRVGVAEQIIQHGQNGILLSPFPDNELAKVLAKLPKQNSQEYSAMSREAVRAYHSGFDNASFAKQFRAIMEDFRLRVLR